MGRVVKKLRCPVHQPDENPSCVLYEDGWLHCFTCGHHAKATTGIINAEPEAPKEIEDVGATLGYIRHLPRRSIRGFDLPCDASGYYLVWSSGDHYKLRLWAIDAPNKYRGPIGHSKPLFVAREAPGPDCIVVEGEFNALSLAKVATCSVVSPGPATDFGSAKYLPQLLKYDTIVVVVDCDKAGGIAAIQLAAQLKKHGKTFSICMVKRDFNGVLCEESEEGLRQYAASVGVPRRLLQQEGGVPPSREAARPGDDDAQERQTATEY